LSKNRRNSTKWADKVSDKERKRKSWARF